MATKPEEVNLPVAQSLQQVVGALLFGSDRPLSVADIRACLRQTAEKDDDPTVKFYAKTAEREVKGAIAGIASELNRIGIGFELVETASGWQFQTQSASGRWLRQLLKVAPATRLSRPTLETLAIIAYRQPVAKSEIESIRGVQVDYIVKMLMELHLVRIVGRSDLPGRPFLYGTTPSFLEHFGLKSLSELNELDPTLQRSDPEERAAKHKKPKKPEPPVVQPELDSPEEQATAQPVENEPPASEDTVSPEELPSLEDLTAQLADEVIATNQRIDAIVNGRDLNDASLDEEDTLEDEEEELDDEDEDTYDDDEELDEDEDEDELEEDEEYEDDEES